MEGISIITCCYNSATRLPATLQHLALQNNAAGIPLELIIVDNNSTDATIATAAQEWKKYNAPYIQKIIAAEKQGLSFARKKGIDAASYNIIIFCDDDNWLSKEYTDIAFEIMQSQNIGIAGGYGEGVCETDKPWWFDNYQNVYAVGKQLPQTGYANERKYLVGAGMIIRKKIFETLSDIGFQSLLSDRKENQLSSGGDSELCLLTMQLGYDLYYDERLQFKHFIPANRLQWSYCETMITKGFAHPQIYFAMYEYCFNSVELSTAADFEKVFSWNKRKQRRVIWNQSKGVGKALFVCKSFFSKTKPGDDKALRIKTAFEKLKYLRNNKKTLSADFFTILQLAKKLVSQKYAFFSQVSSI